MRNNLIINWIAGCVSVGVVATSYLYGSGNFAPARDSELYRSVGEVMARETVSLLKPGAQVIVIARDTTAFPSPATDDQLGEFTKVLRKARITSLDVRRLKVDPLRVLEVPPGDFFELIRKSPEGSVIVSFMGPPVLSDDQLRRLPLTGPSIVAFCPGCLSTRVDLRGLFEQKLLHAAVVSRPDVTSTATGGAGSQALFEKFYIEVTAANVASVLPSAQGAAKPTAK